MLWFGGELFFIGTHLDTWSPAGGAVLGDCGTFGLRPSSQRQVSGRKALKVIPVSGSGLSFLLPDSLGRKEMQPYTPAAIDGASPGAKQSLLRWTIAILF